MAEAEWLRVTKKSLCPICQRDNWCSVHADGMIVICMRVQSLRGSKNGGYVHDLNEPIPVLKLPKKLSPAPAINATAIWLKFRSDQKPHDELALKLGVQPWALNALGIAWSHKHCAWAFPMHDSDGNVIGLRLRADTGKKWSVAGSRNGLFLPLEFTERRQLVLCEGPTDTAAAMSLALPAFGRPNCSGGVDFIKQYCQRSKCKELIIFADRDKAGREGALKLAAAVSAQVKIVSPYQHKDIRTWLQSSATPAMVHTLINNAKWWKK